MRREVESTASSTVSSPRDSESNASVKSEASEDGELVTFNFSETEPKTGTFG